MSKYFYRLIINDEVQKGKKFKYDYGNTKNIIIKIKKYSFEIDLEMTSEYNKENIFKENNYLIYDAVEKAMLIHLILYSESINIKKINLKINDTINQEVLNADKQEIPIYSLINGNLVRKINNNWSNEEFKSLLSYKKSQKSLIMASLYALIMSKSKDNETERFLYLWMAFNGMYGLLYKKVIANNNKRVDDSKALICMEQFLDLKTEDASYLNGVRMKINDEQEKNNPEEKKIIDKINDILVTYEINGKVTKEALINYQNGKLLQDIYKIIEKDKIDKPKEDIVYIAYVFLITIFAYNLRCNYFHASEKVILFSIYKENKLKNLGIINDLLEEYIDSDLNKFFSETYVEDKIISNNIKIEIKNTSKKGKTKEQSQPVYS